MNTKANLFGALFSKKVLVFGLLCGIFCLGVLIRIEYGSRYKKEFMPTESALRFSYAKSIADGAGLPEIDYKAQYPEGLAISKHYPVLMEYTTGYLYKYIKPSLSFADFTRLFIPVFASLSIFAVFLIVKLLWGSAGAALVASFIYAVGLSAVIRSSGWAYMHEPFALPFVFFYVYFLVKTLAERKVVYALISGLFLMFTLGSESLGQFFYISYVCFVAICFISGKEDDIVYRSFIINVFFVVLAGLVFAFLRNNLFLSSYSMLISYALIISYLGKKYISRIRIRPVFIFLLLIVFLIVVFAKHKNYSHVYSMFLYKIFFFGQKPADPTLLPFDVRAYWVGFNLSPSRYTIMYYFFPLMLCGVVSLFSMWHMRLKAKPLLGELYIIYNSILFTILFLLVTRLHVFTVFFLSIVSGFIMISGRQYFRKYNKVFILLIVFCASLECYKTLTFGSPNLFAKALNSFGVKGEPRDYSISTLGDTTADLLEWVKENTSAESVILAHYHISPVIRVYADRPVLLHALFEDDRLRLKIKEFITALYNDESTFYRFCETYGVDYFVYTIDSIMDESRNSWRYLANSLNVSPESVAFKMHFFPERLTRFELVYEDDFQRVFQVVRDPASIKHKKKNSTHPLVYRYDLFKASNQSYARFQDKIERVYALYHHGLEFLYMGEYAKATNFFRSLLLIAPDFAHAYVALALGYEKQGKLAEADRYYKRYRELEPDGKLIEKIKKRLERKVSSFREAS